MQPADASEPRQPCPRGFPSGPARWAPPPSPPAGPAQAAVSPSGLGRLGNRTSSLSPARVLPLEAPVDGPVPPSSPRPPGFLPGGPGGKILARGQLRSPALFQRPAAHPGGLVGRRADGLGAVRSPRIYDGSYSHIVPTEGVWLRGRAWHVPPSPSGAAARGTERMVNE